MSGVQIDERTIEVLRAAGHTDAADLAAKVMAARAEEKPEPPAAEEKPEAPAAQVTMFQPSPAQAAQDAADRAQGQGLLDHMRRSVPDFSAFDNDGGDEDVAA